MNNERKGNWIQTYKGLKFYPLDPRTEDINIEDIAHALSLLTRFGGHCINFYCVAEHSVLIARKMIKDNCSKQEALAALFHDGSEAYLTDIVKPLKEHLPQYSTIEYNVQKAIMQKFTCYDFIPAIVKDYDRKILMDEKLQNMNKSQTEWHTDGETLDIECLFLSPKEAEKEFLNMYNELTSK